MGLNPNVWIPHLKFTLQTMAMTYPKYPNETTNKKYYDFIQNLPLFIPLEPIGKNFLVLLDKYPVTPYLDSRMSFMKWVNFIFNRLAEQMDKEGEEFYESIERYYDEYKPKEIKQEELIKTRKKYIQFGIGFALVLLVYYFYKKE
tara:strand:+ start:1461 stop:1895 length:435 start_codon:yes stop_codon:yes gene_type:complete